MQTTLTIETPIKIKVNFSASKAEPKSQFYPGCPVEVFDVEVIKDKQNIENIIRELQSALDNDSADIEQEILGKLENGEVE